MKLWWREEKNKGIYRYMEGYDKKIRSRKERKKDKKYTAWTYSMK
jgi:hypothetical protein